MYKTNTGKRITLLLVVLLAIAIFSSLAAPADAAGNASKVIVFTDKKVYLTWWMNAKTTVPAFRILQRDNEISPYIFAYAFVLDDDGNIMKGRTVQVTLNDTVFDHYEKANWNVHTSMVANNTYFTNTITMNDTGTFNDSIASDGLYTTTIAMSSALLTDVSNGAPRVDDHIRVKLTARDTASGLNATTYVLVSWGKCHQGPGTNHPAHVTTTASDICTNCHGGYEHFFESVSGTIPDDYTDVHFKVLGDSLPDSTLVVKGMQEYRWNSTQADDPLLDASWKNESGGGAVYCQFCHKDPSASNWFDYGAADRSNLADRPSCSQSTSGYSGDCHSATEIEGTTVIPWTQGGALASTNDTLQGINNQKSHNHTGNKANVSCTLCHAVPHGLMIPNMSVDISSTGDINDQCVVCHNISGGLNITANGGKNVNHTKTECKNCHVDNNLLNSHLVPIGVFGGKWCLNCHNQTGKAPINMKVDQAIVNISNQDYIHNKMNNRSDATNSSRICWGCHTNNSVVRNGRVNATNLSIDEHPGGYDTPRNCTSCHNNTNATINFSAPQTYRHTWYAPNMKTAAVTFCPDCHAQDEELNTWNEEIYPPKTDNESSAHYGRNRSAFFGALGAEYCAYCHQNESTVMGPFANPNNEVRSDHASQNTTPGCGNANCHNEGRMHENTLVLPNFTESNINTTCMACHSTGNYSYHNNTLTCWDCHMGNVSTINDATWIHPIQFIQYNGNFTGAKLTGATCYDCHKSTRVDNATQYLSGKAAPKVNNQAHSNDPNNGTKWGDYWKYTPTTYEFASYEIIGGNGTIDPGHPFENIMVPSNDYMQLNETKIGSGNGSTVPVNRNERQINGPPVPNWTSSTLAGGTTAGGLISATQDAIKGNPAGSLKASLKTGGGAGTYYGYISWNYSFYYKPNTTYGFTYTNASVDYNITVGTALTQNVYLRIVKPSGAIATLASASTSTNTSGWATLTNNSFASVLNEDGSVTPYKLSLYTELQGVKTSKIYTANYDNILLKFQEKVWNRYEIIINTTGVPVNGSSKLGLSYQAHKENTSLMIYNKTSGVYELLDTLNKGVFFDYTKDINSTHHINSVNGITGNVSVKFVDDDQGDTDAVSDLFHIRYLYVFTDRGLQYPCEQCHSPNKHYVNPTIGSPDRFNASNKYNTTDLRNSTWCQQCHWQGAANYSKMILEFNKTRNPPENIPPEITGNATYGNYSKYGGKSKDGTTTYINHTGSGFGDMSDFGCFQCHGKAGDTTTAQFVHNVQAGSSGGRNCTACHDTGGSKNNVNFTAVNMSMHGKLNSGASSTPANSSNKPCWGCHGIKNGTYANESDQPASDHNSTYYKNPRKCYECHITGSLQFTTKNVTDHIPSGYTGSTDVNTSSYNYTYCSYCHNNSVNSGYEPDSMGLSSGTSPMNASVSHYGANKTAGKLMYNSTGNTEDCVYCHRNSSNMVKWGILQGSLANISNKNSSGGGFSHDSYTQSNQCSTCHGSYADTAGFTFHNASLGNGSGGGSGPDCKSCHNISDTDTGRGHIDYTVYSASIHGGINTTAGADENEGCWACHGSGASEGHNTTGDAQGKGKYNAPYVCADCHTSSGTRNAWAISKGALNVSEHYANGSKIKASYNATATFSCLKCHQDMGEMMLPNGDTDYNKTSWSQGGDNYNATIGGNKSPYHYGAKRSTLNGSAQNTDGYCNYCHGNISSVFPYVNQHNKSIFEHTNTTNTSVDIRNTTSLNCNSPVCHGSGKIHNATLTKPAVQSWTAGKLDYCAPCHRAGNASATKYVYGHNSSNINILTTDCGFCHNASSQGQISTGALRIHTSTLTNKSTANTTCVTCHQDSAYVTNQRVVYTHYPGAPAGRANTSLDSFTCEACHGNMPANKMHAPVGIPADRCNNCHNGTTSGSFKATGVPYVDVTKHDNASHNISNNINCDWCHNNTNAIQKFHFTQYPNGTVQAPGWAGWVNGTNANCTNCHNTYNQTKPFYAEPIWHEGNYGATPDNCYQCHTNISSASSGYAPVGLHNVTKVIDWGYCNNCHSNNKGGAPIVDNASLAGGMHSTLNGSTPTNTEPACKACHGGNSTAHKNSTVNNCTYCHITGSVKYNAKNVSRHIPYPFANDVNTSRYQKVFCSDCHNNSLGAFNDATPNTSNATAAHYGMNKTAGKLMYNSSGNTEDCLYCHRNSSNMAKWGILSASNANLSNKGGNHATATNSDCYTCHVNSTSMPVNFHVEDINTGSGGGPDCKACHDIGGMTQGKLVNFSAMNATLAIHKNLNSGASAIVDAENKKCWACHTTNGTAPPAGNHSFVDRYKNPYNCTDCHISKAGQNFNYTPKNTVLNITQHKADSQNGTTIFTPSAGDCYSCHNITEMMVAANDPDTGTGAVYGGLHGGDDSVSHYGLKRNLGSGDAYCNYCHSNASSMFPFANQHNKSIFEHTANGTADIRNTTTLECLDCHTSDLQSYRIHNSTLKTPTASVWTSGKQDRCAPCHKAAGSGSNLKVNNTYHNTTGSITDCGYCHNSDAMRAGNTPQNIHSDNLTAGGNSSYYNCYNCHENGFASRVIIEHTNNSGANTTNASMTCSRGGCHGSNKTHSSTLVKPAINTWTAGGNDYCAPCHNSSDSASNATRKVYNQGHNPSNRTNDNITSCGNCHNASTPGAIPASFRLHDTSMTKSPVEPNASTCQGCHNGTSLFVGAGKQIFSHIPNASQYRGNTSASSYTCEYCHNMTGKPSMHSAGMNRSNGTCATCHLNNTSPFKSTTKNLTQLAGMLNHSYNGSANTTCKMCHNASGRQKFHLTKYASGDIADPQDSNGIPTFELRATSDPNDRGIIVDCRDCHEKYNDTAPFYAPFQEANRTGQNLQEHVGKGYTLNNCYVCHTYEDNVSKPVNTHNVSIEPLSGGPNCTRCHNIGAKDSGKAPNNMLVNFTVFKNYSVHRNLTNATAWNNSNVFGLIDTACWVCHQSNGKQPERHPDLKDDATLTGGRVAYRCPDCHTIGGIVSTYQPNVYQNATKVYKHYPGSVFSGNIVFNSTKQCYMCHQNSQAADINISGYSSNMDANNTNISHYGIRDGLLITNQTQNGCKECHMPGTGNEQVPKDYGNARIMPASHNKMGSSETSCQKSCHNSNSGSNITLHDMNLGVYIGTGGCYSSGCHSLPSSGGRRRR